MTDRLQAPRNRQRQAGRTSSSVSSPQHCPSTGLTSDCSLQTVHLRVLFYFKSHDPYRYSFSSAVFSPPPNSHPHFKILSHNSNLPDPGSSPHRATKTSLLGGDKMLLPSLWRRSKLRHSLLCLPVQQGSVRVSRLFHVTPRKQHM